MEFKINGRELKNVLKVGRAFSRVGENSSPQERSILFIQDPVSCKVKVESTRDLGTFSYTMDSEAMDVVDTNRYFVNAETADRCARELTDASCAVKISLVSGSATAVVGEVTQARKTFRLEGRISPTVRDFVLGEEGTPVVVCDKGSFISILNEMSTMMLRASERPHNFFYLDVDRSEIVACDSHQLMRYKFSTEAVNSTGDNRGLAMIQPNAVWLMKVISAFGEDLKIRVLDQNRFMIQSNGAIGVFQGLAQEKVPDWRLMDVGAVTFQMRAAFFRKDGGYGSVSSWSLGSYRIDR